MSRPTASAVTRKVSLEKMTAAMREVGLLAMPTDWVLLSPDGRMWQGDPAKLLQVLMLHHPLLQMPLLKDHL